MSLSYDDNVAALWSYHQERLDWQPKSVMIPVTESFDSPTIISVDIVSTIGIRKAAKRKTTNDDFYWLPPESNRNEEEFRLKTLNPYFINAAIEAGFNLMAKGLAHIMGIHPLCRTKRGCLGP